jgi:superfamily II DNA helicase RecQ
MKRTTLTLVILALGLGGFVYFDEIRRKNQPEQVAQNHLNQINQGNQQNQQSQKQIFSFAADDIQSLSIKTQDYTLNLERSQKLESPKWLLKSPVSTPAKDAIVSYLTDLLVKGKSENTILTQPNQLSEFGLDKPHATIDIKLKNQKTHQLILGKPNFNDSFLYAQIDPNNQNNESIQVLLVSKDFANAVNRELSEWQEKPDQKLNLEKSQQFDKESSKESTKQADQNTQSQPLPGLPTADPAETK